jgi:acetylornithine deacetylase/succinyl-diaminopimelate desuccinylase-like protein
VQDVDAERVTGILQRLLRAPSFQTDRFEADPEVQRFIGETVCEEARALGLSSERDRMGDLIIRIGPRRAERRAILFAYAMTHPVARMTDPLDGRLLDRLPSDGDAPAIGGPWMRGRGAAEQKGALAAVLEVAGALKRQEHALTGELTVCVSSAGETGRHDTARAVMEHLGEPRADFVVVAIATENAICLANKGRVDAVITVRGRATHSSTPWAGVDAIAGARQILHRLDGVALAGEHPHLGRPTLTVTSIKSFPDATHTVQDEVRIVVDRRLLPGQDHVAAFDDIVRAVGTLPSFEVSVALGPVNRPAEVPRDSVVVQLLEEGLRAAGRTPTHSYSHGCVDAGFFVERGIPAVMFGAGDPRFWHTDDEVVAVPDVITCARALTHATFRHLASRDDVAQDRPS